MILWNSYSTPGKIDDDIRTEIKESAIVLTDFTELNPNVMIEYGLAEAQNKTIVCIAQKGTKLPFDITTKRTIFYENDPQGLETLKVKLIEFFYNYKHS